MSFPRGLFFSIALVLGLSIAVLVPGGCPAAQRCLFLMPGVPVGLCCGVGLGKCAAGPLREVKAHGFGQDTLFIPCFLFL